MQTDPIRASKVCVKTDYCNRCKRVLEVAKLPYVNKIKESITSQKPNLRNFCRLVFSTKLNLL